MSRNKLYIILLIACTAGYIWLYFGLTGINPGAENMEVCLIKHTTNMPCPSCGSTRSVMAITQGNISEALYLNPLGLIISLIMVITPVWLSLDVLGKKDSLFRFYQKVELSLKKPKLALPLVALILLNWGWNIFKGL